MYSNHFHEATSSRNVFVDKDGAVPKFDKAAEFMDKGTLSCHEVKLILAERSAEKGTFAPMPVNLGQCSLCLLLVVTCWGVVGGGKKVNLALSEWNYRWTRHEGYLNKSVIHLQCDNFEFDLTLGCRSVTNHSDNIAVNLEPNRTTGRVDMFKRRGGWKVYEVPKNINSSMCVRFTLAQTRAGNYWKCDVPDGRRGKLIIGYCGSSSSCANMYRNLKLAPVCVNVTDQIDTMGGGWQTMTDKLVGMYPAGVAKCLVEEWTYRGAALEFFFVGKDRSTVHFSLAGVSMNDFIWFDPAPSSNIFYTKDMLGTRCKVSDYGLAIVPLLSVKINASLSAVAELSNFKYVNEDSTRVQNVNINFDDDDFGPGSYDIECGAPVWNTSEWASQSLRFEVRSIVRPYFDTEYEDVTIKEDDTNVGLRCDAGGDPVPHVTWSHSTVAGVYLEGNDHLVFTTVEVPWVNGSTVRCTASNKYGQSATKTFKMNVTPVISATPEGSLVSVGTVFGIVSLITVLLAFAIGLGYLYFKFVRLGNKQRGEVLSEKDVKEFLEGKAVSAADQNQVDGLVTDCLPYNANFEMAKENFVIDFNTELGHGAFGVVYKCRIKRGADADVIQAAVKTVRPEAGKEYYRALLSELKILAYIGEHENIARLMGAYSTNVLQGELYVGVELCKASLEDHLRKNANKFTSETSFNGARGDSESVDQPITTLDLIRWCREVAAGMEYLTTKRIVHADLATRNILLSFEMHAKICDFGLARQLVNYAYFKKMKSNGGCYIPWKWMAIEALRHSHFSTMSDVWSFGVTCWEIFSLGAVPYPCKEWSWEFVEGLEEGKRLRKPKHASEEIFSILRQCWYERKEARPLFSELESFFQKQERKISICRGYAPRDEMD